MRTTPTLTALILLLTAAALRMTEAQAPAIDTGDKLRVSATAAFGPRKSDTDAVPPFDLDFNGLSATGAFTTRDADLEIKGNKYTPPVREKKGRNTMEKHPRPRRHRQQRLHLRDRREKYKLKRAEEAKVAGSEKKESDASDKAK